MDIFKKKIAIIGLGYVGLPLAVEFGKKYKVIGFDINKSRVNELSEGLDITGETQKEEILHAENLALTSSPNDLKNSDIFIITVPTPVDKNNKPDLSFLESASKLVGGLIKKDDIVVYESTVFPGCTREVCVPILEAVSSLKFNQDFYCGYSPERINPGDKKYSLPNIIKVVSGSNKKVLDLISRLYSSIIVAGIFKAPSIEVAEAAKVIENTQRDVNIALINELSLIFDRLNIDTSEVLKAASTKWNFLNFKPGLVGGHCIGVDPYYLTHKALEVGFHPEIILAGRRINDSMGDFIAEKTVSELLKNSVNPINAKVTIIGLTFKENCSDLRNTKVLTIIHKLKDFQCDIKVTDSFASSKDVKKQFNLELLPLGQIRNQDAIVLAVAHEDYVSLSKKIWGRILKPGGVFIDVKSIYSSEFFAKNNFRYWKL